MTVSADAIDKIDEIVKSRDLTRIKPVSVPRPFILADGIQMGSNAGWVKGQAAEAERDGAPWDAVTRIHDTRQWSRWSTIPNEDYLRRLLHTAVSRGLVTIV